MNAAVYGSIALQLIKLVSESVELYRDGTITEDELKQRWSAVGVDFDSAVNLWKGLGVKGP